MAIVYIAPTKLVAAYKYANLLRGKRERRYANDYIQWLRNGAEGLEPERGTLSLKATRAIRSDIDGLQLWDGVRTLPVYSSRCLLLPGVLEAPNHDNA